MLNINVAPNVKLIFSHTIFSDISPTFGQFSGTTLTSVKLSGTLRFSTVGKNDSKIKWYKV